MASSSLLCSGGEAAETMAESCNFFEFMDSIGENIIQGPGLMKVHAISGKPIENLRQNKANEIDVKLENRGEKPFFDSNESCVLKERMMLAIRNFKDSAEHNVLVQVWVPIKNGDKFVLTTSGQPFALDHQSTSLLRYRTVSLTYAFSTDKEDEGNLGLPGRVFQKKRPEWTPNVQFYSRKEYPRLNHALLYDVRGSLAVPIFEASGESCIGVVELITTLQKISYAPEVDKVCKALEAVNFKVPEIVDHPNVQISNDGHRAALAEIRKILISVCDIHNIPLAQTWVPCYYCDVKNYVAVMKDNDSCLKIGDRKVCMSANNAAFCVNEAHVWGFRDACSEHHLKGSEGIVGGAFTSKGPCFCDNICSFSKTEYPLVHYAYMFGLSGSLALHLQSLYAGSGDYVLEIFLPLNCKGKAEQRKLLVSMLATIKQCCQNSFLVLSKEVHDEKSVQMIEICRNVENGGNIPGSHKNCQGHHEMYQEQERSCKSTLHETSGHRDLLRQDTMNYNVKLSDIEAKRCEVNSVGEIKFGRRGLERGRGKLEKSVSMVVLQQYFAGSLKDAAKSVGVCPTTLKRICRQHGIRRWPSRKINKVNNSLRKLQGEIESVRGIDGPFTVTSFTNSSISWPAPSDHKTFTTTHCTRPIAMEAKCLDSDSEPIIDKLSKYNCYFSDAIPGQRDIIAPRDESMERPMTSEFCLSSFSPQSSDPSFALEYKKRFCTERPKSEHMQIARSVSCKDLSELPHGLEWVTIKTSYQDDMVIRFRLSSGSGIFDLHREVSKRFKMEVGAFGIKYFDNDKGNWVLLSCDADLHKCIDASTSSGARVIRLSMTFSNQATRMREAQLI
ncbi:protein NLP7 isoform X2 [Amborella trichopoda]|uniref:protein NLP7 isoform X2 n=1 Tax=Amborella trichopoda TaxID=13333 RepID=UPI0005D380CF|nr:protein NLP7 isoform X2 [Amborella trichopoda]|eukprot:XP_011622934.1 protein NLP7 isoform X2 [Amborella trichopoda]